MKMRKYFVMALVALGATAAFSSCQKDDKTYSDPKIEFRDAKNNPITEFTKDNTEIKVLVTLGDPSLKIKKCEAKVLKADGVVNPDLKLNFKPVKGGADDGKFEAKFTFADTKIVDETNPVVEVKVTDSKDKQTIGKLKYKKAGETPKGTPMQIGKENAYINNIAGPNDALGSYSFTDGMAKESSASDAERQLVNMSVAGEGFVANFNSKSDFKFHKVEGDLKYDGATVEGVKKELDGKTPEAEIKGLKKGDLFVAVKDVEKDPFYLVEVTEVVEGKTTSYIDKTGKVVEGPANTNGGYMKFRYKKNR